MNRLIAIVTDFGLKDGFVGTMKGVIYGINPQSVIVDISHDISPQNIREGLFVLESSYRYFPEETIFLVVVDPGVGSHRKALLLKAEKYFFIGPDNGIFSFLYKKEKPEIIEITNRDYCLPEISQTFHGRDIFAPVAGHISKGIDYSLMGRKIDNIILLPGLVPEILPDKKIMGQIIYIDKFGNLITNITENFLNNRDITIKLKNTIITGLSTSYGEVSPGKPLAIIGSSGYLEIAVNHGNAGDLFCCHGGEKIFLLEG